MVDSIRLKLKNFYGEECCDNIIHYEIQYLYNDCVNLIGKISKITEEEINDPFKEAFSLNEGFYIKVNNILDELIENNKNNWIEFFYNIKNIECDRNFSINVRYIDYSNRIQKSIFKLIKELKNQNNNNQIEYLEEKNLENKEEEINLDEKEKTAELKYEKFDENFFFIQI